MHTNGFFITVVTVINMLIWAQAKHVNTFTTLCMIFLQFAYGLVGVVRFKIMCRPVVEHLFNAYELLLSNIGFVVQV